VKRDVGTKARGLLRKRRGGRPADRRGGGNMRPERETSGARYGSLGEIAWYADNSGTRAIDQHGDLSTMIRRNYGPAAGGTMETASRQ